MKKINMFAVPYAFGGSNIYNEFTKLLDKHIRIIPLNYSGHEARFQEKLIDSIQGMAEDLYKLISENLEEDYCLFGYSMGGIICYEMYQYIKLNKKKLPIHIFIFASDPPDLVERYNNAKDMSIESVKEKLRENGATPNEVLDNNELIEIMSPMIKNDLYALDTYIPTHSSSGIIECPVTLVMGSDEKSLKLCENGWNKYFKMNCNFETIEGGHFFMFNSDLEHKQQIIDIISTSVRIYVK